MHFLLQGLPSFFPQTLNDWFWTLGSLAGFAVAMGKLIHIVYIKPLEKEGKRVHEQLSTAIYNEGTKTKDGLNNLREQVRGVESSCERHGVALEESQRFMEQSRYDRQKIHEGMGRLEGLVESMTKEARERDSRLIAEIHEMALDVRELKTKIGLFEEAKDDLLSLLRLQQQERKQS